MIIHRRDRTLFLYLCGFYIVFTSSTAVPEVTLSAMPLSTASSYRSSLKASAVGTASGDKLTSSLTQSPALSVSVDASYISLVSTSTLLTPISATYSYPEASFSTSYDETGWSYASSSSPLKTPMLTVNSTSTVATASLLLASRESSEIANRVSTMSFSKSSLPRTGFSEFLPATSSPARTSQPSLTVSPTQTTAPPTTEPSLPRFYGNITFNVAWEEFCETLRLPFRQSLQSMLKAQFLKSFDLERIVIANENKCVSPPEEQAAVIFYVKTNGQGDDELTRFLVEQTSKLWRSGDAAQLGSDLAGKITQVVLVYEGLIREEERWPVWLILLVALAAAIFTLWLFCCVWIFCVRRRKREKLKQEKGFCRIDTRGIPHVKATKRESFPREDDDKESYPSSLPVTPVIGCEAVNQGFELHEFGHSLDTTFRPISPNQIVDAHEVDGVDTVECVDDTTTDPFREPFKRLDPLGIPRAKRNTPTPDNFHQPPRAPLPPKLEEEASDQDADSSNDDDSSTSEPPNAPESLLSQNTSEKSTSEEIPPQTKYTRVYFNGKLVKEIPHLPVITQGSVPEQAQANFEDHA